jgi:hypothetical protein
MKVARRTRAFTVRLWLLERLEHGVRWVEHSRLASPPRYGLPRARRLMSEPQCSGENLPVKTPQESKTKFQKFQKQKNQIPYNIPAFVKGAFLSVK